MIKKFKGWRLQARKQYIAAIRSVKGDGGIVG